MGESKNTHDVPGGFEVPGAVLFEDCEIGGVNQSQLWWYDRIKGLIRFPDLDPRDAYWRGMPA